MNRLGGTQADTNPLRLNIARVHVPLSAVLAAWAMRKVGSGLGWLVRHPLLLLPVLVVWFGLRLLDGHGVTATLLVSLTILVGLVLWRVASPEAFTRLVRWRVRGWWRTFRVYRYYWQPAMVTANLEVRTDTKEYLPKRLKVRSTGTRGSGDRADAARPGPRRLDRDGTAVGADLRCPGVPGADHCASSAARAVVPGRGPAHATDPTDASRRSTAPRTWRRCRWPCVRTG